MATTGFQSGCRSAKAVLGHLYTGLVHIIPFRVTGRVTILKKTPTHLREASWHAEVEVRANTLCCEATESPNGWHQVPFGTDYSGIASLRSSRYLFPFLLTDI